MLDTQNQGPQCIDQQKESSMALRIRQHDRNPNLGWASSSEETVAYIARIFGLSSCHIFPSIPTCSKGDVLGD